MWESVPIREIERCPKNGSPKDGVRPCAVLSLGGDRFYLHKPELLWPALLERAIREAVSLVHRLLGIMFGLLIPVETTGFVRVVFCQFA